MLKTLILAYALAVSIGGTNIIGSVKDYETKDKISNAQVIINESDTVYTDVSGNFTYTLEKGKELMCIEINASEYDMKKYVFVEEEEHEKLKTKKKLFKKKKEDV